MSLYLGLDQGHDIRSTDIDPLAFGLYRLGSIAHGADLL